MKKCIKCNVEKSLDNFNFRNKEKNYRHSSCKQCSSAYARDRWTNNINGTRDKGRKSNREYNYRARYNAPEEVIQKLIENPVGNCEICGTETQLFVDHCHNTNKYRGLICRNCNLMLGYAKDNINTLLSGVQYLKDK